jgi:2-(1,2-epoxy-1,2-dihydrophenyl)acetyl-CoA isomerase
VYNSFNRPMGRALLKALQVCADDADIRAVYLSGTGKAFCAGQDLNELQEPNPPAFDELLGNYYNPIILQITALKKPVVAAVNGVAAGAGANLALACDLRVLGKGATIGLTECALGIIPGAGGTQRMPRLVGVGPAVELAVSGESIDGAAAALVGLVDACVPAGQALESARRLIDVHGSTDFCALAGRYADGTCDEFCDLTDPDCLMAVGSGSGGAGGGAGSGSGCDSTGAAGLGWASLLALLARRRQTR